MTVVPSGMRPSEQGLRTASSVVARVFGAWPVTAPRADTPLSALGGIDSAWVLIDQALADETDGAVRLDDADIDGITTLGDLAEFIDNRRGIAP
ncbi:MAG: hypothetical protein F2793_02200 [Actinobacteria bacterium]|uniref:Unannotated protein n=1 Tax=freshwater metagenome TaxID=449393 RepID=A0A6J7D571_9ZZZZ|nr:hypothetical protein [Actinomycetota bacterium]